MNIPEPMLPCTLTWNTVYDFIEHRDSEGLTGLPLLPLSTDLTIVHYLSNARTEIKWIINHISVPIQSGDRFWFHFESDPNTLFLGKLSIIHSFFGIYVLVEILPMLRLDWDNGLMAEAGTSFWMTAHDLILDKRQ
jgi:hypothetical protein